MNFENIKVGDTVYVVETVEFNHTINYFTVPAKVRSVKKKTFRIETGETFMQNNGHAYAKWNRHEHSKAYVKGEYDGIIKGAKDMLPEYRHALESRNLLLKVTAKLHWLRVTDVEKMKQILEILQ